MHEFNMNTGCVISNVNTELFKRNMYVLKNTAFTFLIRSVLTHLLTCSYSFVTCLEDVTDLYGVGGSRGGSFSSHLKLSSKNLQSERVGDQNGL